MVSKAMSGVKRPVLLVRTGHAEGKVGRERKVLIASPQEATELMESKEKVMREAAGALLI